MTVTISVVRMRPKDSAISGDRYPRRTAECRNRRMRACVCVCVCGGRRPNVRASGLVGGTGVGRLEALGDPPAG